MSLLESAESHVLRIGGTCGVPAILAALPDDERAELLAWFALPKPMHPPATAIASALNDRGLTVKPPTLTRHARGGCQCR